MSEAGYVNYFDVLGLQMGANPGEVRNAYRRQMKKLVAEIASARLTEERRSHYLLEMAKLNAALFVLRDKDGRNQYLEQREELIALEKKWVETPTQDTVVCDALRREFDAKIRQFLSKYVEESMLEAGRDKECVEHSHWDHAHERHVFRILRHYRHRLYHDILERIPYSEVTPPAIDWEERAATVSALLAGEAG